MKSIAALLLTIALALFPLSGTRVMAAAQAHAHEVVQDGPRHEHAGGHHHGSPDEHVAAAADAHGSMDGHARNDAPDESCGGDHASSSCCSLSCHAMAPHAGPGVVAQRHVTLLVGPVALPLPHGIGFDGLLRPPRPA